MLNKIIILNSKPYAKAEITLDTDSLQIVGANNIGKTTLINCLNFLFIIDGNKMQFGDHDFIKSINHYFPSSKQSPKNTSYMVFEIFKRGYYCIMLVRNDKNIEYYRIESEYNEDYFFNKNENDQKVLRNFQELNHYFATQTDMKLEHLKDKRQVFSTVYQRGRKNQGVVWVNENIKQSELSNNFTKIYRYLLNSTLINSYSLKEALMIADNRENESVIFSENDKKDLIELEKLRNQIQKVKSVEKNFDKFKIIVNQFHKKSNLVSKLYFEFLEKYNIETTEIEKQIETNKITITETTSVIENELKPNQEEISKEFGKLELTIENAEKQLNESIALLKLIESYDPEIFLKSQLSDLQKQADDIDYNLKSIERQKISKQQITDKINKLKKEIEKLQNQIDNFNNLLIHNISEDNEIRKTINSILSNQITKSDKSKIIKPISTLNTHLNIFDGTIELELNNLQIEPIENIEDLKVSLNDKNFELQQAKQILEIIIQKEKKEEELQKIRAGIKTIENKLNQIANYENLVNQIVNAQLVLLEYKTKLSETKQQLTDIKNEITTKSNKIVELNNENFTLQNKLSQLNVHNNFFLQQNITPIETEISENTINKINNNLRSELSEKNILASEKNEFKENLKRDISCDYSDENELIKYIEDQISFAEIVGQQRIDELLQAIAEQFSKPTHRFLGIYQHFKTYILKFNNDLAQFSISDIEKISIYCDDNDRIIKELKQITEIQNIEKGQLLFPNNPENLTTLDNYLKDSRKINFDRLFEIHLEITKRNEKGELVTTKADLSKEVESNGTNRMIKMFIFLLVINRMIESDKENRLAVYIDELGDFDTNNLEEIKKFCKQNNFIPIFAAPRMIPDVLFDKYYLLAKEKGKVIINEQRTIYVTKN